MALISIFLPYLYPFYIICSPCSYVLIYNSRYHKTIQMPISKASATRGRNFETFFWKYNQTLCNVRTTIPKIYNQLVECETNCDSTSHSFDERLRTKYRFKIIRDWIKDKYRSKQFFLLHISINDSSYTSIIKSRRYSAILVRTRNSSIIKHPAFQNLYIARVALSVLLAPILNT